MCLFGWFPWSVLFGLVARLAPSDWVPGCAPLSGFYLNGISAIALVFDLTSGFAQTAPDLTNHANSTISVVYPWLADVSRTRACWSWLAAGLGHIQHRGSILCQACCPMGSRVALPLGNCLCVGALRDGLVVVCACSVHLNIMVARPSGYWRSRPND